MTERSLLIRPVNVFVELLLVGNTLFVAWLALAAFLVGSLPLNDDVAFGLSTSGWRRIALTNLAVDTTIGLILIGVAFLINRALIRRFEPSRGRLATMIAYSSAALVIFSGLASGIHFLTANPFI